MVALIFLFFNLVASLFKAKSRLEAENAALRHQLTVLQGKVRGRVQFTNSDRLFFIQLYRWFPSNPYPRAGIYPASLSRRPLALMRGPQGNLLTVERRVAGSWMRFSDHGVDVLKDRVRSVMTEGVLTCSADDRVGAIMAAMVARRIRHIPVVDEEGWLRGLVSMSDVVKYQLHEIQAEADAMGEYISGR
jgi:CBS domain